MGLEFKFKFKNINLVNKYPICRIELNSNDIFFGKVEQKIVLNADTQENNVLRIFFENKEDRNKVHLGKIYVYNKNILGFTYCKAFENKENSTKLFSMLCADFTVRSLK